MTSSDVQGKIVEGGVGWIPASDSEGGRVDERRGEGPVGVALTVGGSKGERVAKPEETRAQQAAQDWEDGWQN